MISGRLSSILAAAFLSVGSIAANAALIPFRVTLTGTQEVPGPGDPDGSGVALLIFDSAANRVDWLIAPANIDLPLTGAHIHTGAAGVAGPVIINFNGQLSGSVVDPDVASVLADPTNFYVNLHNAPFPAGAIRGQLESAALIPFSAYLTGAQEVPGPGDPDGDGVALLNLDSATNRVDWLIAATNIGLPLTGAHIHTGAAGVSGPVIINFNGQLSGSVVDPDVASVLADPTNFYVNLHNASFPAGAIRGQLDDLLFRDGFE